MTLHVYLLGLVIAGYADGGTREIDIIMQEQCAVARGFRFYELSPGHKSKSGASDFGTFAKNQNTIFMLNIPLLDAYLVYLCHTYLFNHLISIFMLYIPLLDIIWFRRRWQKKGPFRTPDFDSCPRHFRRQHEHKQQPQQQQTHLSWGDNQSRTRCGHCNNGNCVDCCRNGERRGEQRS